MRKATQKRCGTARNTSRESQFPVPPVVRMKSQFPPAYPRTLQLGNCRLQHRLLAARTSARVLNFCVEIS